MERQGAYKYQANADFKKGLRSKAVETRRKDKRRETMMRNRRMPLEEKTESNVPAQKEIGIELHVLNSYKILHFSSKETSFTKRV